MDEEAKRKLDGLFAKDRTQAKAAEKRRDTEAEAQAALVEAYLEARERVIVPAFEEFAGYVREHGWSSKIETRDEEPESTNYRGQRSGPTAAGASISFARGETPPAPGLGRSVPHFSINCNKRDKRVEFHTCTIGPNHGGSAGGAGSAKVEELTPDAIQTKMVDFFAKLLSDARPYGER